MGKVLSLLLTEVLQCFSTTLVFVTSYRFTLLTAATVTDNADFGSIFSFEFIFLH